MQITISKTCTPKEKPALQEIRFGKFFTDHMFLMEYDAEEGWHNARIVPYGSLELEPSTFVLHYAVSTFEGMKCYRSDKDEIFLFRPYENAKRMNRSNERLCMPSISNELFVEAVKSLVLVDKEWIPKGKGTSLYLRPFMYASQKGLGISSSTSYQFVIIASPVRSLYEKGLHPLSIYVEEEYVRAVKGGTGEAKCGGNYAASILAQEKAAKMGYSQVLWLDGIEHKYIEEVGTMNVFFKIEGKVYTSSLDGSILPGITRDSILHLLHEWKEEVVEAPLPIELVMEAGRRGTLEEVFGCGTAALITPIGELCYMGERVKTKERVGTLTMKIFEELSSIQWGEKEDLYNWRYLVNGDRLDISSKHIR